jgi:two-component system, sensor histidine kinase PdtaS
VVLDQGAGGLCLRVSDDGGGVSPDFTLDQSKSLGLRIANTLAAQMGGCFTLSPGPQGGAMAQLILPPRAAC